MDHIIINGSQRLLGELTIHGAKNSVLPIMAASLLCQDVTELENCPLLSDVTGAADILRLLGCDVQTRDHTLYIDSRGLCRSEIPDEQMRGMRSSIIFMGALLAKTGRAQLSLPGGCDLGNRPIDLHLSALRRLGAHIEETGGQLICDVGNGLIGCELSLELPSVGATENVLLAAVLAKGTTILHNAAREPEITDLCRYLNHCGARIRRSGDSTLTIEGVSRLYGCRHRIIPDRIEAVTYLASAAVTGGELRLRRVIPSHLSPVLPALQEMGCRLVPEGDSIRLTAPPRLHRVRSVRTTPYPGFPTDAQAPIMAMACVASGTSIFVENIFDSRYKHVGELRRLGARIRVEDRVAVVEGVPSLNGTSVECTDLRGGAALVIAGLSAQGQTVIGNLSHIDRGYENLCGNLRLLGADIVRESERSADHLSISR